MEMLIEFIEKEIKDLEETMDYYLEKLIIYQELMG